MVYAIALVAAVALGIGYVLQQRVAARAADAPPLSASLLRQILHRWQWWAGLATMAAGQALGSWAMGLRSLALVEPLLTVSLLVAFVTAGALARRWPTWQEVAGSALLAGALGVFLGLSQPSATHDAHWSGPAVGSGVVAVAGLTLGLVAVARHQALAAEAVLLATASGCLYGLQDAATRGVQIAYRHGSVLAVVGSPWPYLLAAAALTGLYLTQSAYRAGRLDYSLPPAAAAEPVVAIGLGLGLLGDRLSTAPGLLAVDAACVVAMVGGAVLIARSPVLARLGAGGSDELSPTG